jgi:hypothetical protein
MFLNIDMRRSMKLHLEFRHLRTIRAIHEAGGLAPRRRGFTSRNRR